MAAALEHLAERAGSRWKVAVLGDMAELGPGAVAYHRQVGAVAARAGVAVLVAVGPLARGYLAGARGVPETHWAPTLTPGSPRFGPSSARATASSSRARASWASRRSPTPLVVTYV